MPAKQELRRLSKAPRRAFVRLLVIAVGLFAATLAIVVAPGLAPAETLAAWVELIGPGRAASIRVIVSESTGCPILTADGERLEMQVRAEPGPIFSEGDLPPDAHFPVRVCEADLPNGKAEVLLDGNVLPLPRTEVQRIVVFGDTGCRIKKKKIQDCLDRSEWPYAMVAVHAALAHPDLVIHVGDYLYRESCGRSACEDTQTGYGWDVWNADFFTPSAPLFAAAPWIMVRGNHENCSRAGDGWFRFLDRAAVDASCSEMSPPYVIDLGSLSFVVMDSAAVAGSDDASAMDDDDDDDDDEAGSGPTRDLIDEIRRQYQTIAASIPTRAWLLTHSPFDAVRRDKMTGENKVDNTVQQQALGDLLSPNIAMIVSGHIHLFEALTFDGTDPKRPPQLVVGTGGDKLAKKPDDPRDVDGVTVADALILKSFGYMVWDRDGVNWNGALFDADGDPVARCRLATRDLICRKE
jgi:hypothetical protein